MQFKKNILLTTCAYIIYLPVVLEVHANEFVMT